jgi:exosome complex component RRP4
LRLTPIKCLKNATGCRITVGQNGLVWLSGEPEKEIIAVKAIKLIEEKAHKAGLTDEIKAFLEKETGGKIKMEEAKKPVEAKSGEVRK